MPPEGFFGCPQDRKHMFSQIRGSMLLRGVLLKAEVGSCSFEKRGCGVEGEGVGF